MRYLFLDRIISIEEDKSIRTIKAITSSEDFFLDHFPANPVMPGALIIEAAAQAGTALIEISAAYTKKAFLIMVQDAKFRVLVKPGATLIIDLTITNKDAESIRTDCEVTMIVPGSEEQCVATLSLTFGIRPVEEFYSEEVRRYLRSNYETWLLSADKKSTDL